MAINYIKNLQTQLQEPTPQTSEEPQPPSILRHLLKTPPPFESVFLKDDDLTDQHFFDEEPSAYKQLFLLDEDQDE